MFEFINKKGFEKMSRRISFPDFLGKEDSDINALFSEDDESRSTAMKRILTKIINNELSERQKQVINLYYFKNMTIVSIAEMLNLSPSSVSITLRRARNRIIKYMKYYF